jgi:hypothetical protein
MLPHDDGCFSDQTTSSGAAEGQHQRAISQVSDQEAALVDDQVGNSKFRL